MIEEIHVQEVVQKKGWGDQNIQSLAVLKDQLKMGKLRRTCYIQDKIAMSLWMNQEDRWQRYWSRKGGIEFLL